MDTHYINLFKELAHATEITAENMLEKNYKNKDAEGKKGAEFMRDDYAKLYDFMRDPNFDSSQLTRAHFAKFLVAALIFSRQLENKIQSDKKVVSGYKTDIIPKLDRILNETKDNENCLKLANELFTISET